MAKANKAGAQGSTTDAVPNVCSKCGKAHDAKPKDGKCKDCGAFIQTDAAPAMCPECENPMTECECEDKAAKPAKKKADSVLRVDMQDFAWDMLTEPVTTTAEGFMRGRAAVTNIGVFPYLMADGSVRRELRLPDEVFHPDSLASLKMKPLTLNHPAQGVTPETAQDLQVGSVGDAIWCDAFRVYAPLAITRKDAIDAVKGGKQALSCGYSCDLEFESGNWMGVQYDAIQRNIRYNHVALVDKGRAGDDAILRMDAAAPANFGIHQHTHKEPAMATKTIKLDGVGAEFQADEAVITRLSETTARADKAEGDLATAQAAHKDAAAKLEGERDSHKDRADKAEAALKAQADAMPAAVAAAVAARVQLAKVAMDMGVEIKPEHTDADIMGAVVLKAFPKADAAKFVDANYLKARFDAAVESQGAQVNADNKAAAADVPPAGGTADKADRYDACAAEKKMKDQITNAWKGTK